MNVLWTTSSLALSCPPSSKLVTQDNPHGKEERCVLGSSGKRHGPFQTWYVNGNLRLEGNYRYGKPQGGWTYYYPNGQKRMEGNWRFGKAQGPWTYWYESGVRESAGLFRGGKREGSWSYWDTAGNMRLVGNWKNGVFDFEGAQASPASTVRSRRVQETVGEHPGG